MSKPSRISLVMVSLISSQSKNETAVRPIPYSLSSAENYGKKYMNILDSGRIRGKLKAIKWIESKGYSQANSKKAIDLTNSNYHSCISNRDSLGIFIDYEPDDVYTLYYVQSIIRMN